MACVVGFWFFGLGLTRLVTLYPSEDTLEALVASRERTAEYTVHLTNEVPFATQTLTPLQRGRAFKVAVRPKTDPVIQVTLP